jgi:hypothetical protein
MSGLQVQTLLEQEFLRYIIILDKIMTDRILILKTHEGRRNVSLTECFPFFQGEVCM